MQISKILLAVCATTVCAGFLSLHAQDTPAQAAARAALMQSMGQPAAAAPAAPKMSPPPAAPKAPVAPVAAVPAAAPVAVSPQPIDSEAQAAARAALLQSMGQSDIPATPVAAPAVSTPAPAPTVPAPVVVAPVAMAPAPATPAAPEAKPVAANPTKSSNAPVVGQEAGFAPIVAPPLPISAAKQQQLDALLVQYQADQISPEEYHKQRAAILAAP